MTTDIAEVVAHQFPGIVIQKNLVDAIAAWLIDHDAVSDDDVPVILALACATDAAGSGQTMSGRWLLRLHLARPDRERHAAYCSFLDAATRC